MKIFNAEQIKKADQYTIANEPISSLDLMERAAGSAAKWIRKRLGKRRNVVLFCGTGNNGGDGLVIARKLASKGIDVKVFEVKLGEQASPDYKANAERLSKKGVELEVVTEDSPLPEIKADSVIIDAIFGIGLNRPIKGWLAKLIEHINQQGALRIAIDLPSGLMAENNDEHKGAIVKAHITLTFQLSKLAFFFPSNAAYIGYWEVLPIGLHEDFLLHEPAANFYFTRELAALLLKPRPKFGHKGTFGHALLMTGSKGKMGAGVLTTKACLRTGVGLATAFVPNVGLQIMQTALPEAMCIVDESEDYLTKTLKLDGYSAVGIGPGIGTEKATHNVVKTLIQNAGKPIVLDADAINILAENKTWLEFLPQGSILTPHPGEFAQLVGRIGNDYARYQKLKEFAVRYKVYVVLKGAHTAIASPKGEVFFNSTGNPGMATAGSGDVLTGIITSLLAQGYSSGQATLLGVWLHGCAGDMAKQKLGMEALLASDIIDHLSEAFRQLRSV